MNVQPSSNIVYQADPNSVQQLKQVRDNWHQAAQQAMNRQVRITTIDGQTIDGTIVGVDHRCLHISVPQSSPDPRAYNPYYYNNVILPLVLFELLVIALL